MLDLHWGFSFITTRPTLQIFMVIKEKLSILFFMEINDMEHLDNKEWLDVNDIDLQVLACERKFLSEFPLIMLRVKPDMVPAMETWVNLV
jgi:hypothetical protein